MPGRRSFAWQALSALRTGEALSRPELAERLGISLPTVGGLINELLDAGLLLTAGRAEGRGGRPALMVKLNPEAALTLGVSVSQMEISVVLADLAGTVVARAGDGVSTGSNRRAIEKAITNSISSLLRTHGDAGKPAGLAVAISGIVDAERGVSRTFPYAPEWRDVPLGETLSRRFQMPAEIWNDVQAATLAELYFGVGRRAEEFLYVHVGRGIGLGVVVNGKLLRGWAGCAGEFGHTVIDPKGPICSCGNYGCLESIASPPAIVAGALDAIGRGVQSSLAARMQHRSGGVSIDQVFEAAKHGDRLAGNLLYVAGEYLGIALANAANILNPRTVVMGGILSDVDEDGEPRASVLIETIARTFHSRLLPVLGDVTELSVSTLGRHASALGAAAVAGDAFLRRASQRLGGKA